MLYIIDVSHFLSSKTAKQKDDKMKQFVIVSVLVAFLATLAFTGCSSSHKPGSGAYEKSEGGKKREGSGGY